jgi:hypothetical protein
MHTFVLAFALQVMLPLFDATPQLARVSILNKSSEAADFEIGVNAENGSVRRVKKIRLAARQQTILSVNEIGHRPEDGVPGWISVDSISSDYDASMILNDGTTIMTAEGVTSSSKSFHLPNVRLLTGFDESANIDTKIAIINRSLLPASVAADVIDQRGDIRNTLELSVPPAGSKIVRISEALPLQPGRNRFEGRIFLRSTAPIAAWQQLERAKTRSVLRGKGFDEVIQATNLFAPFFVLGGFFESTLNLVNPTNSPLSLDIGALDTEGRPIGERTDVVIPAGGSLRSEISSLLSIVMPATYPKPLTTGSLHIRAWPGGPFRVMADVEVTGFDPNAGPESSMSYSLTPAAEVWDIPFTTRGEQYFTSYAVVNAGGTAHVRSVVEVYGVDGSFLERRSHLLAPFGSVTGIIGPTIPAGRIRIWSYQPISVLGALGSANGRNIEAIPTRH